MWPSCCSAVSEARSEALPKHHCYQQVCGTRTMTPRNQPSLAGPPPCLSLGRWQSCEPIHVEKKASSIGYIRTIRSWRVCGLELSVFGKAGRTDIRLLKFRLHHEQPGREPCCEHTSNSTRWSRNQEGLSSCPHCIPNHCSWSAHWAASLSLPSRSPSSPLPSMSSTSSS